MNEYTIGPLTIKPLNQDPELERLIAEHVRRHHEAMLRHALYFGPHLTGSNRQCDCLGALHQSDCKVGSA